MDSRWRSAFLGVHNNPAIPARFVSLLGHNMALGGYPDWTWAVFGGMV